MTNRKYFPKRKKRIREKTSIMGNVKKSPKKESKGILVFVRMFLTFHISYLKTGLDI